MLNSTQERWRFLFATNAEIKAGRIISTQYLRLDFIERYTQYEVLRKCAGEKHKDDPKTVITTG